MSYSAEFTELDAGRIGFVIRSGSRVATQGDIASNGRIEAPAFPTDDIAARMDFVAGLYADEGVTPEDFTFELEEAA